MDNRSPCPVCRTANVGRASAGSSTLEIYCPRCGRFHIQTLAETKLMNSPPAFPPLHLLSGFCRNTWEIMGEKPLITINLFQSWAEFDKASKIVIPRDTDIATKSEYLLKYLRRKSKALADVITLTPNELAVGFCAHKNDLLFCLRYLVERTLIEEQPTTPRVKGAVSNSLSYRLTPAGWALLDTPRASATQPLAAIALTTTTEADLIWTEGFSAGVQKAGYTAIRVDNHEHANKINDELIVNVRQASIIIADLTGQSALSYFEAGLALGLGKPIFWTCEENEARDKKLLVETRQYVITTWTRDKLDAFATRLAQRIEATLGRPPVNLL